MSSDPSMQDDPRPPIAVLGLGAMGARIAARLLQAGYRVIVWNRTAGKAAPLVERGGEPASSPAEAAARAETVITMLADPSALRSVTVETDGVVAAIRPGTTWLEMSTVGPRSIAWLAETLPPEVDLLDAPVLGSISEAESGTLSIFVGGLEDVFIAQRRTLSTLGSAMHVGPLGSGAAAKLVANLTLIDLLGTLGEALALARRLGIDGDMVWEVLAQTPIAAQAERRRRAIESDTYPTRFSLGLARKDADLIEEAASERGVDLRMTRAARGWLAEAEAAGLGNLDYSVVLRHISQAKTGNAPTEDGGGR